MPRKPFKLSFLTLLWLFWPGLALAAEGNTTLSPLTVFLGLLSFGLALVCFFLAWKIYSFLKKGELALPWQMLGLSFFILGLAQLLDLASNSGWLAITPLSASFARFLALTLLVVGLHRTSKILG